MSIKSMHIISMLSFGIFVGSAAVAEETRPQRKDTRLPQPKQARLTTYVIPKALRPGQTFTFNIKVSLDPGWRIFLCVTKVIDVKSAISEQDCCGNQQNSPRRV